MTIQLIPISVHEGGESGEILHVNENTMSRRSYRGIKKPCEINVRDERQFRKAEVTALLSMLNAYNNHKRILV